MRCKYLFVFLLVSGLLGCDVFLKSPLEPVVDSPRWVLDDGQLALTPMYHVHHVQGEPFTNVSAAFRSNALKKIVRLRPGDSISVNGHVLPIQEDSTGLDYHAKIATTEGTFTFVLTRASRPIMSHSFELPAIGVPELPKIYDYAYAFGTIYVPVKYVIPPPYVTDSYSMDIHIPGRGIGLVSSVEDKGNGYEPDRLPDIRGGSIRFRDLIGNFPPSGRYPASLYHLHNITLSKMSDASPSGWIDLINIQKFSIEVR